MDSYRTQISKGREKMNHEERESFSRVLSDKVVKAHRNVILSGIYGSTVRGTDTKWSDLDMLFVVEGKNQEKSFVYKDTVVNYKMISVEELEKILTIPTMDWPFWMGILDVLKVIYGNPLQVKRWLEIGQNLSRNRLRDILEENLPSLVFESYGRILSSQKRKNTKDVNVSAIEIVLEMNKALCLLNQKWVTHDYYQGIMDVCTFPKLPKRYEKIAPLLWCSHETNEAVMLSKNLVNDFLELLVNEGIKVRNHQNVNELQV